MAPWTPWRGRSERRLRGLVASAAAVDSTIRSEYARRRHADWQDRAFVYMDKVGEAALSARFYEKMLVKLGLGLGRYQWNETTGEYEVEPLSGQGDTRLRAVWDEVQDPDGGRAGMLSSYGRLMFGPGECYAVGTQPDKVGRPQWEMLSHKELRITQDDRYQRVDMPGGKPQVLDAVADDAWVPVGDEAIVVRLWNPSSAYSWVATSPMQPVLDILEELLLIDQAIHARLTNRAAGPGILYIPNSIAGAIPDVEPRTPDERQMTPIMRVLTRGMTTPISQPGHASAVVPIVLTGPDEAGAQIVHISFYDQASEWPEVANREKAMTRLGQVSDFPMEYLLGLQDSNHWSAWQVDDQTWSAHGQPVAERMIRDWSAAILRPLLVARGACSEEEADQVTLTYDESEVVTRPDRSGAAKDGYDRGIVNGAAYRRETGFDEEDDAMDEEEYSRWLGWQLKDAGLALTGEVTEKPAPVLPFPPQPQNGDQPQQDGPPAPPAEVAPEAASMSARILGAAELAVIVSREKAGSRLRSRASNCPDCVAAIKGVPKSMIAATLGADAVQDVPEAAFLVDGGTDAFMQQCLAWGVPLSAAAYLSGAVTRHAADTLYDDDPVGVPKELVGYVESAV